MTPRVAAHFLQSPRNDYALGEGALPRVRAQDLALPALRADHAAKLDEMLRVLEVYEEVGQPIVDNVVVMRRAVVETATEPAEDES
jgi:hypothetical protein